MSKTLPAAALFLSLAAATRAAEPSPYAHGPGR